MIHLQDRDRRLFDDFVASGGLLDSKTIHARLFPGDRSGEACLRRLRMFCGEGLLETIRPALAFGAATTGRLPSVYRLTSKGADLIHELTGERPAASGTGISTLTLEHRLGIARLRLVVNDACAAEGFAEPNWIGEYDPMPGQRPGPNAKLSERYRLCHQYPQQGTSVTCWPDAAALVGVPGDQSGQVHRLLMLWEYDRSTERLAQVKAKLPGYRLLTGRQDDRRLFEVESVTTRAFFVVKSAERRESIAAAIKDEAGSEFVRLAVVSDLTPAALFREPVWFTSRGDARAILPKRTKNPAVAGGVSDSAEAS